MLRCLLLIITSLSIYEFTSKAEGSDYVECSPDETDVTPIRVLHQSVLCRSPSDATILYIDNNASRSLPDYLELRLSGISRAGLGVWATKPVERGTVLGLYGGQIYINAADIGDYTYTWTVSKDGEPAYHVDARDVDHSNWLRYVNCSPTAATQNVYPCERPDGIYYQAVVDIPAGTELLIWYGDAYAEWLGLPISNQTLDQSIVNGLCRFSTENLRFETTTTMTTTTTTTTT